MPASTNFLVQVTLLKTSNPVVSRLLSVPADVQFIDLHFAIEASFGWTKGKAPNDVEACVFKVVHGNPMLFEDPDLEDHVLRVGVYTFDNTISIEGSERGSPSGDEGSTYQVHEVFGSFKYREKHILYDYGNNFMHAIQVLGRSNEDAGGRITCIGGQGFTTQKAWNQGRGKAGEYDGGGPSTWDLDLAEVCARVEQVEIERLKIGREIQDFVAFEDAQHAMSGQ